jgi:hypothetical protein
MTVALPRAECAESRLQSALEVIATLASGLFAGAAIYINWSNTLLMWLDTPTRPRNRHRVTRATLMQAPPV